MNAPTIGWSQFALDRHKPGEGNSYSTLPPGDVVRLVQQYWHARAPGQGETNLSRKVVVPIGFTAGTFVIPRVRLEDLPIGTKLQAEVTVRQEGEKPYIETYLPYEQFLDLHIKTVEPKYVSIVCYSAEALLENGGKRTTEDEWEIVCLLASENWEQEPMTPLTMARNYLQEAGGTKSVYTADEFAQAIWYHSTKGRVKVR